MDISKFNNEKLKQKKKSKYPKFNTNIIFPQIRELQQNSSILILNKNRYIIYHVTLFSKLRLYSNKINFAALQNLIVQPNFEVIFFTAQRAACHIQKIILRLKFKIKLARKKFSSLNKFISKSYVNWLYNKISMLPRFINLKLIVKKYYINKLFQKINNQNLLIYNNKCSIRKNKIIKINKSLIHQYEILKLNMNNCLKRVQKYRNSLYFKNRPHIHGPRKPLAYVTWHRASRIRWKIEHQHKYVLQHAASSLHLFQNNWVFTPKYMKQNLPQITELTNKFLFFNFEFRFPYNRQEYRSKWHYKLEIRKNLNVILNQYIKPKLTIISFSTHLMKFLSYLIGDHIQYQHNIVQSLISFFFYHYFKLNQTLIKTKFNKKYIIKIHYTMRRFPILYRQIQSYVKYNFKFSNCINNSSKRLVKFKTQFTKFSKMPIYFLGRFFNRFVFLKRKQKINHLIKIKLKKKDKLVKLYNDFLIHEIPNTLRQNIFMWTKFIYTIYLKNLKNNIDSKDNVFYIPHTIKYAFREHVTFKYKQLFKRYILVAKQFFDLIYINKHKKHTPPFGIFKRIKQFEELSGFRRLRDYFVKRGKYTSRFRFFQWDKIVKSKKLFFKMRIVLDRLFKWLYKSKNIVYIFGVKLHKTQFVNKLIYNNFIYKKQFKLQYIF